jgi:hypothetical protein
MPVDALLILMILLAACGGFLVALLVQARVKTSRAIDHVVAINALSRTRVDERARPAP